MKIVCDSCSTKYSIADEKVKGKVFKIRCKKCSHIIVVKGTTEAGAEGGAKPGTFDQKETRVFDYAGFDGKDGAAGGPPPGAEAGETSADLSGDGVWHLVVDREQVGPMTVAEVQARFEAGEIDADTYGWREGFTDWQKISAIPDFAAFTHAGNGQAAAANGSAPGETSPSPRAEVRDLFASAAAGDEAEAGGGGGDLFGGSSGSGSGLFSGAPAQPEVRAAKRDDDLFASAGPSSGGGDLFGGGGDAGAGQIESQSSMKGQRNENSVLFSLNNLAALASGPAKGGASSSPSSSSSGGGGGAQPGYANSQTEGSGLIDIRAMAATTLGMGARPAAGSNNNSMDDLPVLSSSPFSVGASPILVPVSGQSNTPPWLMPAMIGLGVLLVGVAGVLVFLLTRSPKKVEVAANDKAAAAAPAAAGATAAALPTAGTTAAGTPDPAAVAAPTPAAAGTTQGIDPGAVAAADTAAKAGRDKGHSSSSRDKAKDPGKVDTGTKAVPVDTKVVKPEAGTAMSKGDLEIKCMINPDLPMCRKGGTTPKPDTSDKPEKTDKGSGDLPEQLGKPEIQSGIAAIKGSATGCFDKYKVPGTVMVKLTISPAGGVAGATATGAFAGTPTGSCVESAVKRARFKKFSGNAMTVNYPFVLR